MPGSDDLDTGDAQPPVERSVDEEEAVPPPTRSPESSVAFDPGEAPLTAELRAAAGDEAAGHERAGSGFGLVDDREARYDAGAWVLLAAPGDPPTPHRARESGEVSPEARDGRFERLNALFEQALELRPKARQAFLDEACADDPDLAREVLDLIAADDEVEGAFPSLGALAALAALEASPPKKIGPYEIVREIGRGGMGVVYEAQQSEPRRRVALKAVARLGLQEPRQRGRFVREARVLGQLAHPGIVHVYEAGTAVVHGERWPYFAMEYVEGEPIDRFIDEARAPAEVSIDLLARVCDAVQHAHERGVVHRDLKPSNIFVVQADHAPLQPKILDFGIARLTRGEHEAATNLRTTTGQIVGTVGYMSPEQLAADGRVDARSDVYALGVVLFRLLTGRLPYDLHGKPLAEIARVVREEEPARLSAVDRRWRGDLDTIITKALEKDPERRYASAAALAVDLRRHLAHEPIVARPPSVRYRTRKFARRNKAVVAGVMTTMAALLAGLVVATAAFVRANEERRSAEAVTDFLAELMTAARPEAGGKDVTLRRVLEDASSRIEADFAEQPTVKARLEFTLARTYASLGDYARAEPSAAHAIALWTEHVGSDDEQTLRARALHGEILYFLGRREASGEVFAATYAEADRALGPEHPITLTALGSAGFIHMRMGRYDAAEAAFAKALEAWRRVDPNHKEALDLMSNYAVLLTRQQRREEAETIYADIIERYRQKLGPEHPETLLALANLAAHYNQTGRPALARPLLEQVLDSQRRVLGETHSKTLITQNNLAAGLSDLGEWGEGERLIREGLRLATDTYGPEGPSTLMFTHSLGRLLRERGELEGAERILVPSLALHERVYGDSGRASLMALYEVVQLRLDQSRFEDALQVGERLDAAAEGAATRCRYRVLVARAEIGLRRFEAATRTLDACADDELAAELVREARATLEAARAAAGEDGGE